MKTILSLFDGISGGQQALKNLNIIDSNAKVYASEIDKYAISTTNKLTLNECCRLQGFPDYYVSHLSNAQGYKALGNSFNMPTIEHLLQSII